MAFFEHEYSSVRRGLSVNDLAEAFSTREICARVFMETFDRRRPGKIVKEASCPNV